jgi:branched-chain amino acid transport system permease protein
MNTWKTPSFWLILGLVVAAGLAVFMSHSPTLREEMFLLFMFAVLATSLNILLGYTGYINFGHIVFFGLGGYVGFYLMSQQGWPLWWAALAGGLSSATLAFLLGTATLRLRGAYFALATIGVNEAVRAFVNNFRPFGGPTGMSLNFSAYQEYGGPANALWITFGAMFGLALLSLIVSSVVKASRFGLGLMAIREDEDAAMVMGVRTPMTKTWAYVLSAVFPGICGVLFFFKNGNVEPGDAFRLQMSIETIVMVMLGGQGTVLGPIVGAATYERMRGYLLTSDLFKNLHLAVAGLLLLIIVLFIPAGLVGWLRGHFPRLRRVLQ